MQTLSTPIFPWLPKLTPLAVVDILVTAFFLYQLLAIVRGRRAERVLTGIWFLVLLYLVALWARLELLRGLLAAVAPYTVFALIVMFQSDLRRMLAGIGRGWTAWRSRLESRESIEEIKMALEVLAGARMGALIVVEREIGLRTFVESGVVLDATLSRDLLLSIFQPGGAMHDGAVIVQGNRVAAAACFLPLSMNPKWMTLYGTRHRAAIGITEEADCVAIVVSEETGNISIAEGGEMEFAVGLDRVAERLAGESRRRGVNDARELGEQRVRP
jgi:diadenylate cyclase